MYLTQALHRAVQRKPEFVVKTSRATNQHGELVAEMRTVIVCRN
jgi:hypothetical protein